MKSYCYVICDESDLDYHLGIVFGRVSCDHEVSGVICSNNTYDKVRNKLSRFVVYIDDTVASNEILVVCGEHIDEYVIIPDSVCVGKVTITQGDNMATERVIYGSRKHPSDFVGKVVTAYSTTGLNRQIRYKVLVESFDLSSGIVAIRKQGANRVMMVKDADWTVDDQ